MSKLKDATMIDATEEHYGRNYHTIKRVDNRAEIE